MKTSAPDTIIRRERERARAMRFAKAWKRAVADQMAATDWRFPARVTVNADSGDWCVNAGTMFYGCGYCAHIIANRPAFESLLETGERMLYTPRCWYASERVDLSRRQQPSKLRDLAAGMLARLREIIQDSIGNEPEGDAR